MKLNSLFSNPISTIKAQVVGATLQKICACWVGRRVVRVKYTLEENTFMRVTDSMPWYMGL
jgi:hypothetical protein